MTMQEPLKKVVIKSEHTGPEDEDTKVSFYRAKVLEKGLTVLSTTAVKNLREPLPHYLMVQHKSKQFSYKELQSFLEKLYPKEHPVSLIKSIGCLKKNNSLSWFPLKKLDDIADKKKSRQILLSPIYHHSISELMKVMEKLRGENGCPWDRQQNHMSLRPYLLEESYEVIAAIEKEDYDSLREELGDLLLQVIFHASLGEEKGNFSFAEVVCEVIEKLVRRHPHVFDAQKKISVGEVKKRWEEIKKDEKKTACKDYGGILQVDEFLPALMRAHKIQGKASGVGFDWNSSEGPYKKILEEICELGEVMGANSKDEAEEETGDLLFSVVNLSRFLGVNPEIALNRAIGKFISRFAFIEGKAAAERREISSYSIDELEIWWKEAKEKE